MHGSRMATGSSSVALPILTTILALNLPQIPLRLGGLSTLHLTLRVDNRKQVSEDCIVHMKRGQT